MGVMAGSPTFPHLPPSQLCPLRTLPPSCEGFLEAGLVACFLLMLSIFSSPRTRCCSSSGRLWSRDKVWGCAPGYQLAPGGRGRRNGGVVVQRALTPRPLSDRCPAYRNTHL